MELQEFLAAASAAQGLSAKPQQHRKSQEPAQLLVIDQGTEGNEGKQVAGQDMVISQMAALSKPGT